MNVLVNIFGYSLTYIEFFGVLAYFASVYLATKINIWTWLTGIISSILFFILYFKSQTFANAILQIMLIIISIKGWLKWGKEDNKKVKTLNWKNRLYIFLISIISIIFFGYMLDYFISEPYPYLDMSIFVLSIIGTFLLANKNIESWFFWIAVNIISLFLYSSLCYYLIGIQSIIFIIIDIFALREWNKKLVKL